MIQNKNSLEKNAIIFNWQRPNHKRSMTSVVSAPSTKSGFTLIELLVVIAIIGLLASVVLVSLSSSRIKARNSRRVADINQISKAFELYFNNYFSYPTTNSSISQATLGPISGSSSACGAVAGCLNNFIPNIMLKTPIAPVPADASSAVDCSASYAGGIANDYQIAGSGNLNSNKNYTVTFCISAQVGTLGAGVHTLTNGGMQ